MALGAYGERLAARYLQDKGLNILGRNWRCADGEIDIIAQDGHDLVICEVKTRRTLSYGVPAEAVTWKKVARLKKLAGWWLLAHPEESNRTAGLRIDVIGVLVPRSGRPVIDHLVGIAS
ncbi:YraN family protein [Austwickia chelonae]|uniref:YraN family protein n=1 Tax=Austwickia chelonae TaxID=100225 RepID=UPI0023DDAD54|nr:YraN family protein [Austwickia chelonae]